MSSGDTPVVHSLCAYYFSCHFTFTFTLLFSHLADAFIQSNLQIRKSN